MTRFSLFRFVIWLPLIAGIVFAIYSFRINSNLTNFDYEVDNNQLMVSLDGLLDTFGEEQTRKIVELKASDNKSLIYDGESRLAQIVKSRHVHDHDNSDLCALSFVGIRGAGWRGPAIWSGPNGMRIDSVSFDDNELLVTIHGDLGWGPHAFFIPESEPETYSIPWAANGKGKPNRGNFSTLILARVNKNKLSGAKK